jgi:hypothetical protein
MGRLQRRLATLRSWCSGLLNCINCEQGGKGDDNEAELLMSFVSPEDVLFCPGSLISATGDIIAPYDLETASEPLTTYRRSTSDRRVRHADSAPFRVDWAMTSTVHIVNGMGVTLGDSVIGLTAIAAIKARFPRVRVHLYRPAHAPRYVEELYALAAGLVIDQCETLPYALSRLPADAMIIDVGNHLFWPRFSDTAMIDFFLDALGMDPSAVDRAHKQNTWLSSLPCRTRTAAAKQKPYVLFCPSASTPLRSIPKTVRPQLVDAIARQYEMPVLGFGHIAHPAYRDITGESTSTESFVEWVREASFVMSGDSAAVHLAAGFGIPTTAFFSSIEPGLRVRDYSNCNPISLAVPELRSIQASSRPGDTRLIERAFAAVLYNGLQLPHLGP